MKANVTISRCSDNKVYISLEDDLSGVKFVEVALALEDYAMLITGCAYVEGEVSYNNLSAVGKIEVSEKRSVNCPHSAWTDKTVLSNWLKENCKEEGWTISTYLGSQGSVKSVEGGCVLNYTVYKYVDNE